MTDDDRPMLVDEVADWFRVTDLTPRELEVLECVADGMGHREIAAALGLRPWTVRAHQRSIRRKLGAPTMANAVSLWERSKATVG